MCRVLICHVRFCFLCVSSRSVLQDWDFPHFINAMDIKLPGLNTANVRVRIPRCLRRERLWEVHITGGRDSGRSTSQVGEALGGPHHRWDRLWEVHITGGRGCGRSTSQVGQALRDAHHRWDRL